MKDETTDVRRIHAFLYEKANHFLFVGIKLNMCLKQSCFLLALTNHTHKHKTIYCDISNSVNFNTTQTVCTHIPREHIILYS